MGVQQLEVETTRAAGGWRLETEDNTERVLAAAGPGVGRTRRKPTVVLTLGTPYVAERFAWADGLLCAYADAEPSVEAAVEALAGESPVRGRLPVTVSSRFPFGAGVVLDRTVLREGTPEEAGFTRPGLAALEEIVRAGIRDSAYPCAQLAVVRNGVLAVDRAYGTSTYERTTREIDRNTIFDLASLTKVIATTTAVMKLYEEERIRLDTRVAEFSVSAIGVVTGALHNMGKGDIVGVRGPLGNGYPLDTFKGRSLLLIGGGFGFSTLRSLTNFILHEHNRSAYGDLTIIYGARKPGLLLYKADLEAWKGHKDLNLYLTVDQEADGWEGHVGLVPNVTKLIAPSPKNTFAVVCGPPVMMKYTLPVLKGLGFDAENILFSMEMRMKCGIGNRYTKRFLHLILQRVGESSATWMGGVPCRRRRGGAGLPRR